MILATLATEIWNFTDIFFALQEFDSEEDKLELEYHKTWWQRETQDLTTKTFVENLS